MSSLQRWGIKYLLNIDAVTSSELRSKPEGLNFWKPGEIKLQQRSSEPDSPPPTFQPSPFEFRNVKATQIAGCHPIVKIHKQKKKQKLAIAKELFTGVPLFFPHRFLESPGRWPGASVVPSRRAAGRQQAAARREPIPGPPCPGVAKSATASDFAVPLLNPLLGGLPQLSPLIRFGENFSPNWNQLYALNSEKQIYICQVCRVKPDSNEGTDSEAEEASAAWRMLLPVLQVGSNFVCCLTCKQLSVLAIENFTDIKIRSQILSIIMFINVNVKPKQFTDFF